MLSGVCFVEATYYYFATNEQANNGDLSLWQLFRCRGDAA